MSTSSTRAVILCMAAALLAPGCGALSAKSDPGTARYFSIEPPPDRAGAGPTAPAEPRKDPPELRIGRITGSPHLDERMVYRSSAYEIGYYQDVRWTEPPEAYLGRLLSAALFENRGLRQVVGGPGATLDVQLTALDEVRVPQHLARAQVVVGLHDEHLMIWQATLSVDRPIPEAKEKDRAGTLAAALGDALRTVVDQVADRVVRELETPR